MSDQLVANRRERMSQALGVGRVGAEARVQIRVDVVTQGVHFGFRGRAGVEGGDGRRQRAFLVERGFARE